MHFYEFEVKRLFEKHGIKVPRGGTAKTADQAEQLASDIGGPVVVKAQVLARARSKAGGVRFADTPAAAKSAAQDLLALTISGQKPPCVLVEQKIDAAKLYGVNATYDGLARRPVLVATAMGGQNLDEIEQKQPGAILRRHFSALTPLADYRAKELARRLGFGGDTIGGMTTLLSRLCDVMLRYDFTYCEINALAQLADGSFCALDGHADLEAEARSRQTGLIKELGVENPETRGARAPTAFEREAAKIDAEDPRGIISPVMEFDGNMGLVIGAGGGSITTFDAIIRQGGKPANYCAIGGNPSVKKAERLTKLVLSKPGVEKICVISNVVSNTRADLVARGVIKGVKALGFEPKDKITIFRVPGAWEADAFKILEKYGVEYCDRTVSLSEAARRAVEKAKA